jgi:eukaryotic-like serine/threonine-protein kinase
MAKVYLADDTRHNRQVAIKVLKPEFGAALGAERFLAEIETTGRLQHSHILPLFDSGEAGGSLFYVMPWVQGETLQERIHREKQLSIEDALAITTAVADALQTAHDAGVVHRDVKPSNILLGRGQPLLADFGIALAVGQVSGLTETGVSIGTPRYMSPEQAHGDQHVGRSSDTFSLACVLFEMLVGEPPDASTLIHGAPVSAAAIRKSVPPNVDGAFRKALERLPADRFKEIRDFAKALTDPSFRYGEGSGVSALPSRRWRLGALGIAVTVVALGFALLSAWALTQPDGPARTVRASIRLPEPVVGHLGTMALSRDGSMLVYEGPSEEGPHQLWVRRWSELTASPLSGTATGIHPSFSPDEREIAYMDRGTRQSQDNRLMVTPTEGGVPRVLHEPIRGYPHRGSDGYVYFMDVATGGISRIPGSGGSVEPITERGDGDRTPHYNPIFVADGNAVLFVVEVADSWHIRTVNLSSGAVSTLVIAGVRPHATSSGHLVYLTPSGDITVAPFDARTMTVTGAGVPVIQGLEFNRTYSRLIVSGNGTLVYATARSSKRYQPVWVDRAGSATPIDPEWGFDPGGAWSGLSLSPDGRRLAVGIHGGVAQDIWVKELPRGPLTRLTTGSDWETRPRWISGGRVSYVSVREGPGALYARPGDGTGHAELLLSHERQILEGVVSQDGEWLIARVGSGISVAGVPPGRDVVGVRLAKGTTAGPLMAAEFDEKAIMLSPDGRWLAYESDETGRNEIYVRPFPNVDAAKWAVSVHGGIMPLWSRAGDALFYVNAANEMVEVQVSSTPSLSLGERKTLFSLGPEFLIPQTGNYTLYDIAPDDQSFLMLRLEERETRELILVLNWFEELTQIGSARIGPVVNGSGRIAGHALTDREERSGRDEQREAHPPQMARQARPAARQAESHDAHVAGRRQEQDAGEEERHHTDRAKRDASRGKARTGDGLDAAHDRQGRECERERQRRRIDAGGSMATRAGRSSAPCRRSTRPSIRRSHSRGSRRLRP